MRKAGVLIILPFFLAGYLGAQSVAELAQKEKERRESLKGKKGLVITNGVLANSKKKAAVTVQEPLGSLLQTEEAAPPPATAGEQAAGAPAQPAPEPETELISESEFRALKSNFENAWKDSQRSVDDLTQRMNELWQSYYSMNDMTSRDLIQQRIAETYQALLKAQEDAVKFKGDFDAFIAKAVKEGVPPTWIK